MSSLEPSSLGNSYVQVRNFTNNYASRTPNFDQNPSDEAHEAQ